MREPFFDFIASTRDTVSNHLYGRDTESKRYKRASYQKLPAVPDPDLSLISSMRKRSTTRQFSDEPLSLERLSAVLKFSIAQDQLSAGLLRHLFPSGGGFYPVETYLMINHVVGLEPGVYHYSGSEHSLAKIGEAVIGSLDEINTNYGCAFRSIPHVILHMTMVKSRVIHKYGSMSYVLALIEAGHRGQNLSLSAAAHELGVCSMGGGNYDKINALLGVDGMNEHHIYGVALGLAGK